MRKIAAITLFFILAAPLAVRADDFGAPHDVGSVRADGHMLLAHRARVAKIDPKSIVISDVVVVGDQAVFSWSIGTQHGLMGLVRQNNRWWDALDAYAQSRAWLVSTVPPLQPHFPPNTASAHDIGSTALKAHGLTAELVAAALTHNADVAHSESDNYKGALTVDYYGFESTNLPLKAAGGTLLTWRGNTSGYDITIRYAPNTAVSGSKFTRIYARPPTPAEFLPYPTPYRYTSDALMFFDIVIDGPKAVSFQQGTSFDVWFPFALDESLKYRISFGGGQEPIGPVIGSVFDNVVHFDLPGFTALPGKELMGEIDGDFH